MAVTAQRTETRDGTADLPRPPASTAAEPFPPSGTRSGRARAGSALADLAWPVGTLAAVLVAWEVWVFVAAVPRYLMPPPSRAISAMFTDAGVLLPHAWVTLQETLMGFVLSVLVSLPVALAIVSWRRVEKSIYPLIVASQVVPKVAVAPLFMVWLGFGIEPKVLIVVLIAFFPIVVNAVIGLKSVEMEKLYLARSMGASPWRTFWKIRLPQSLPSLFAGLKLAATFSVIGAIVGEFIGADKGLGRMLLIANGNLDTVRLFAVIGYLSFMGVALFLVMDVIERLLIPWHVSQRVEHMTTL